jgi:hypothetical protein
MTTNAIDQDDTTAPTTTTYEPPQLIEIGRANDVILGVPGIGLDGPNGYTEWAFEFEPDE